MTNEYNCIATGIGSLPHQDPGEAAGLALASLPEAPIWPQLPQKDFREHMDGQYSETMPGLRVDKDKNRIYFDTAKDLTPELEKFFQRYLDKDYAFFKISEEYAAGFYAFLRSLQKGIPPGARFLKGHITGPLTFGTSVKDEKGYDIIHNEVLFDAVVKGLAMKAAWQIEVFKPFGLPVIIFIDEPAMESLGSAFSAVAAETVSEKLNEIIDVIHDRGGIAGIHCCGNADWPMLFRTGVDIINFDAFGYLDRVLLYPDDIKTFIARGGALAWGVVPTAEFTGQETAEGLVAKIEAGMKTLGKQGIDRARLMRQCLITPSCGMGSLTPGKTEAILKLLREVSGKMQNNLAAK